MTQRVKADLEARVAAVLPDNDTREISPADVRGVVVDVIDSAALRETRTLTPGRLLVGDAGGGVAAADVAAADVAARLLPRPALPADAGKRPTVTASGAYELQTPAGGSGPPAGVEGYARTNTADRIPEPRLPRKLDDLLDALQDSTGYHDAGDDAADDEWVSSGLTQGAPSLAQAAAATYARRYANPGGTLLSGYAAIRVPNARIAERARLVTHGPIVDDEESLGNIHTEDTWTALGVRGSFTYFHRQTNLPGGEWLQVQRWLKLEWNQSLIDVLRAHDAPPSLLLPRPALPADAGKRPTVTASGAYELQTPADGNGPAGPAGPAGPEGPAGPAGTTYQAIAATDYAARRTAGTLRADVLYVETGTPPAGTSTPILTEYPPITLTARLTTTGVNIPASGVLLIGSRQNVAGGTTLASIAQEAVQCRVLRAMPAVVPETTLTGANSLLTAHGRVARSTGGHVTFQWSGNNVVTLWLATMV